MSLPWDIHFIKFVGPMWKKCFGHCCQLYLQQESSRRHQKTSSNCALPRGFGDAQTMMTPVAELCEIEEVFVFDAWLQISNAET